MPHALNMAAAFRDRLVVLSRGAVVVDRVASTHFLRRSPGAIGIAYGTC